MENQHLSLSNKQEVHETVQTKIVALWFVLGGVAAILLGLFYGLALIGSGGQMPLSQSIFFLGMAAISFFLSFYSFRISSLIHRLDEDGYRTALMYLSVMIVGSVLYGGTLFILGRPFSLLPVLVGISLNGIIALLLYSQRTVFVRKSDVKVFEKVAILLGVLLLLTLVGLYLPYAAEKSYKKAIHKELLRAEPVVTSWEKYKDEEFDFELEYPEGWYVSVREKSELEPEKIEVIEIGFSEEELSPQFSLSRDTYFYIAIAPASKKEEWAVFGQMISNPHILDYPQYEKTVLDGKQGVRYAGSVSLTPSGGSILIAVECGDYIYGLGLRAIRDKDLNWVASDISKRILSSFKFIES